MNSICGTEKKNLLIRLRRIEGQIRGIHKMIEEDQYCVDVLTQVVAARGALQKVGLKVLDDHIHGCVRRAFEEDDDEKNQELIDELMKVLSKFSA